MQTVLSWSLYEIEMRKFFGIFLTQFLSTGFVGELLIIFYTSFFKDDISSEWDKMFVEDVLARYTGLLGDLFAKLLFTKEN